MVAMQNAEMNAVNNAVEQGDDNITMFDDTTEYFITILECGTTIYEESDDIVISL